MNGNCLYRPRNEREMDVSWLNVAAVLESGVEPPHSGTLSRRSDVVEQRRTPVPLGFFATSASTSGSRTCISLNNKRLRRISVVKDYFTTARMALATKLKNKEGGK